MCTSHPGDLQTQCVATSGHGLTTDGESLFLQNLRKEYFRLAGDDLERVSKTDYFNVVFEGHYKQAFFGLTDHEIAVGSDGIYATHYQASNLEVYDFDRTLLHQWEDFFDWYPVYDIVLEDEKHLWYTAPTCDYVGKKSFSSQEEVFGMGGTWGFNDKTFDHPESLFLADGSLYIADMGNHRVCRLNLSTYELDEQYLVFADERNVWEYCRVGDREYVVLSDAQSQEAADSIGIPKMQVHEVVNQM